MRWGAGHVIEPPLLCMAWGVIHDPFRLEFFVDHQTGSHVGLKEHTPGTRTVVVPDHPKLDLGTLRAILKLAGIDITPLLSVILLLRE